MPVVAQQPGSDDSGLAALLNLNDAQRQQIGARRAIVAAWQAMCNEFENASKAKGAATALFLQKHPELSQARLYRWAAAVAEGDFLGLLDKRSKAYRPAVEAIDPVDWQRFKNLYLTIQKRSLKLCYQIVQHEAGQAGRNCPSVATFRRRVAKDLPPAYANFFRLGEREWKRRYGLKLKRDYSQYRAGECYVGDFHIADVFCRKSETNPTIVRPLISAFEDMRSRKIVACLVVERECQDSVLQAFKHACLADGIPCQALIDNGKPYRAKGFSGGRPGRRIDDEAYVRSVLGQIGCEAHFSIPYNPDSKNVERWFRTLEEQFGATFESYCSGNNSSPTFKAAYELARKHPEKCPTVAQYTEGLARHVAAYNVTPHSAPDMEGLSPAEAFQRFDPVAKAVASKDVIDVLFMRQVGPVKVTQHGVRHNKIDYGWGDPALFRMQGQEVLLRADSTDASYVLVCDLQGKPLVKAFNSRALSAGLTQDDVAEGMKAKNRTKRLVKEIQEGGLRPATRDVLDAALKAKWESAPPAAIAAATGTDDVAPRNLRPVGGELTEAVAAMSRRHTPPPADDQPILITDLDLPGEPAKQEPTLSLADVLAAVDGDADPFADPEAEKEWGNGYEP
jgi:transposase InsO family protein